MATPAPQVEPKSLEAQVLDIVRDMLLEQGKRDLAAKLTPQSSFQRDLGLASLDLVELVVRCESKLDMELPDEIAEQADTPAGWVRAIQQGSQDARAKSVYRIVPPSGEAIPLPERAGNLAEVLRWHAEAAPGRIHIHLIEEGSGRGITCAQLLDAAETIARGLISRGLRRDDAVALMLPNGEEFLQAFFGVMLAGGVPVPVYPPADPSRIAEYVERQCSMLAAAGIRLLISFDEARPVARLLSVNLPSLIGVTTVGALRQLGRRASGKLPDPSATALIQFTSGSTGEAKGVVLTHESLLGNIRAIGRRLEVQPTDAVVSWLPLASDMGLVGCWLFSLYHATPLTLLSPLEFERRPESWLWAIHDSRGTLSAAPNSAYEHCARRIPLWTLEGIDLSCWRAAVNAGEPVQRSTVEHFTRRFSGSGFGAESMLPCYGLAESSVALAIPAPGRGPLVDDEGCYSVGPPLPGHEVRLEGDRLLFRGASRCAGYVGGRGLDDWIDTGDLARIVDGEIYLTGRSKDVILKHGRQLAPQTLENAAAAVAGVRPCCVIAIGVADPATGTEKLVLVAESTASGADMARVQAGVGIAVTDACGLQPDEVLLIPPGTLPKTSNGKLQRQKASRLYLAGKLGANGPPPAVQFTGLLAKNSGSLLRRGFIATLTGGARIVRNTAARLTALVTGCVVRIAGPGIVPASSRLVLCILGRQPKRKGELLSGPAVVMANRCGRLDPLTLAALVDGKVVFSGEEGTMHLPPLASFLIRPAIAASQEEIEEALRRSSVVILLPDSPVGTTAARSRYRLAALHAALNTGAPVIPVALQELRRQTLAKSAGPLTPDASQATALREQARESLSRIYG